MAIVGTTCWGHSTGVVESNVRTFADHWTGTGTISGAGDAEIIELDSGEYMESEVVQTGVRTIDLYQNLYDVTGDDVTLKYRTGAAEDLSAESWTEYTVPFESLGYVQVRLENPAGGNATDYKRDFEVNDNTGWTETDAGSKLDYYSATQAHAGTRSQGITIDADGVVAYNTYDMGANKTPFSCCFWLYLDPTSGTSAMKVWVADDGIGQQALYVSVYQFSDDEFRTIAMLGATESSSISLTGYADAWVRIEIHAVKDAESSLSVYNAAGAQIGVTRTCTADNFNMRYVHLGVQGTTDNRGSIYFDDIGFDWTDGTTPLWPFS